MLSNYFIRTLDAVSQITEIDRNLILSPCRKVEVVDARSLVVCVLKITEGANGNVINNTITSGDPITVQLNNGDSVSTSSISYCYSFPFGGF